MVYIGAFFESGPGKLAVGSILFGGALAWTIQKKPEKRFPVGHCSRAEPSLLSRALAECPKLPHPTQRPTHHSFLAPTSPWRSMVLAIALRLNPVRLCWMFCENASTSPAPRRGAIAENAAHVRFILTDGGLTGAWCLRLLPMGRKSRQSKDSPTAISFIPCRWPLSIMMLSSAGTAPRTDHVGGSVRSGGTHRIECRNPRMDERKHL